MRARAVATLLLGALVACGGGARDGSAPRDTLSAAPPETPLPDSVPLVVLEQSGGIAGGTSELTVHRSAEVTLAQNPAPGGIPVRRWTISPDDYQALESLVTGTAFRALDSVYLPDDPCCDRITYVVTVPGAAGAQRVRTMDAAQQPDPLADLLERLRALEAGAPQ